MGELTRRLDRPVKSDDVDEQQEEEEVEATAVLCWQPAVGRIVRRIDKELDLSDINSVLSESTCSRERGR